MSKFDIGQVYTREEIHKNTDGGSIESYLPHINNKVQAICLREDLNPSFQDYLNEKCGLPEGIKAILVGRGEEREHSANLLSNQFKDNIPCFLKLEPGKWQFIGEFNYFGHTGGNKDILKEYSKYSTNEDIVDVLFVKDVASKSNVTVLKRKSKEVKKQAA